ADAAEPVVVVDEDRLGRDDAAELRLEAALVPRQGLGVEELALARLARRVADHSGRAADERDVTVPGAREPRRHRERHEVAGVERGRRRVVAAVEADRTGGELRAQAFLVGDIVDEPARAELGQNITWHNRKLEFHGSHTRELGRRRWPRPRSGARDRATEGRPARR